MCRFHILMVAPPAGERELFLGGQHGELADLLEIPREVALGSDVNDGRGQGKAPFVVAANSSRMARDCGQRLTEPVMSAGRDHHVPATRPILAAAVPDVPTDADTPVHIGETGYTGPH